MIKTGFFGGTFDPIHFGHLSMAVDLMEAHGLDEVWFSPANFNPHKSEGDAVSVEHRLAMVERAIEDITGFSVVDLEAKKEGPSYTAETLEQLIANESGRQFFLILGDEALPALPRWHRIEDIVEWVPLLVGRRQLQPDGGSCVEHPKLWDAALKGMTPTSLMEISATAIRDRLSKGLCCGHLVPAKVLDYIKQHRLYSSHG